MRILLAAGLFSISVATLALGAAGAPPASRPPAKAKKTKYEPKNFYPPNAAALKQIQAKTAELRQAVAGLKAKKIPDEALIEVEIYLKAAENIVRFQEWYSKASVSWARTTLDRGLERARQAQGGKAVWREAPGHWVLRAYRSSIDNSIQPFAVLLPTDYGKDPKKKWPLDIVLHGRDSSLTEAKFIATHDSSRSAPKDLAFIQMEVYGRGNNAYRWAGERDVFEARLAVSLVPGDEADKRSLEIDPNRILLRGFSMGGAGAWHLGLRHPGYFCAIGPGAGFTTTHGYIGGLPAKLPDYQEKCLRIYDAYNYAENAVNVPVIAYSGQLDAQKAAADNIEKALQGFSGQLHFKHVIAPGLKHQQPKPWQEKLEAEYKVFRAKGRGVGRERIRFVSYVPGFCDWVNLVALDELYQKAVVDVTRKGTAIEVRTENARQLNLMFRFWKAPQIVSIDGQKLPVPRDQRVMRLEKQNGRWEASELDTRAEMERLTRKPIKSARGRIGPIDDAFKIRFLVVKPTQEGWHAATTRYAQAEISRFAALWDRYFRGKLPVSTSAQLAERPLPVMDGFKLDFSSFILFGDPASNPEIAKALPRLPIKWTKDELVVNGISYDPKTHVPVLIYPKLGSGYYVLNSGHTFREADLKGTNALLYPRLGDWAVIKPKPTAKDPAAYEVVAAGLFDSNWQFVKDFAAPGAKVEKLWGEGQFTEGPVEGADGAIYFSDIGNRIMKFDPKTGKTAEFRNPSGRSNGLKFDKKGRLLAAEGASPGGNRRISRTEKDGTIKTLAGKFNGKRFNSPNDLTLDSKGRIYFTDPRYGGDEPLELPRQSVYRIDPDGTVTEVVKDVKKPNGLVISPDGKTLYLAENEPKGEHKLLAYPLNADGSVGKRKDLYDFGSGRGIDGMTVAADGTIIATAGSGANAGIYFFNPEGKRIGFLQTPDDPSNCCLAGPDKKTLYITAGKSLYRVKLK